MNKDIRLISVDWDFFFPVIERPAQSRFRGEWQLYDWGHSESRSTALECFIWLTRATAFFHHNLPLPGLSGEEQDFWKRVDIRGAEVYVAESHCQIAAPEVLRGVREVVSFDAHHDSGYQEKPLVRIMDEGTVLCDDWAVHAQTVARDGVRVIYPRWREHALAREVPHFEVNLTREVDQGQHLGRFERVFICRSGAWTPPWLDDAFTLFTARTVEEAGAAWLKVMEVIEPRDFNETVARESAGIDLRALNWMKENMPEKLNG